VRGVPVFVHWSFPLGGCAIALVATDDLESGAGYGLAYAALIALHELAHAATARRLGIRVHAIELAGVGGLCHFQVPRSTRDTLLVYSAGLIAQVVLLVATLATVAIFGMPRAPFAAAVVAMFTWGNGVLFLVNLAPGRSQRGLLTDGGMLWGMARHLYLDGPHPLAAALAASPVFEPTRRLLTIAELVPEGFVDGIEILNDDSTPMEFVVEMLECHAGLSREAAIASMLDIHKRGGMLVSMPDRKSAEAAAEAIASATHAQRHSLVCRAVSSADDVDQAPGRT